MRLMISIVVVALTTALAAKVFGWPVAIVVLIAVALILGFAG